MFAKGDMVRVKAGSPRYCSQGSTMGPYETDYGKGFVVQGVRRYNDVVCCILSGTNAINAEYLELWNDKEEWNGYQWVAKSTGVDESKEIHERNMRDEWNMCDEWKPRVGDAVRVKAGTPPYADREDCSGIGCPSESQFGRKLIYDNSNILTEYLEPWNDKEEWDGKKWVAKTLREHGLKVGDSVDVIDGNLKGGKSIIEKIDESGDSAILCGWSWWIPTAFLRKREPIEAAVHPRKFIMADRVRVKAAATKFITSGGTLEPYAESFGRMLVVTNTDRVTSQGKPAYKVRYATGGNYDTIGEEYLEPWIDAESWDGEKWVAKGCPVPPKESPFACETSTESEESLPPEFVMVGDVKYVPDPSYSVAEQVTRSVLIDIEKRSKTAFFGKHEWEAIPVGVSRTGNRISITYDFGK